MAQMGPITPVWDVAMTCGAPAIPAGRDTPRAVVRGLFGCLFTAADIAAAGVPHQETVVPWLSPSGAAHLKASRAAVAHRLRDKMRRLDPAPPEGPYILPLPRRSPRRSSGSTSGDPPTMSGRAGRLPKGFSRLPGGWWWRNTLKGRIAVHQPFDVSVWANLHRLTAPTAAFLDLARSGPESCAAARVWGKRWRTAAAPFLSVSELGREAPPLPSGRRGVPSAPTSIPPSCTVSQPPALMVPAMHVAAAWMWCLDLGDLEALDVLRRATGAELWGLAAAYLLVVARHQSEHRAHPELSYLVPEALAAGLRRNPNLAVTYLYQAAALTLGQWFVVQVLRMRVWHLGRRACSAFLAAETLWESDLLRAHTTEDLLRVTLLARATPRSVRAWSQRVGRGAIWNGPLESITGMIGYRGAHGPLRFAHAGSAPFPSAADWIRLQVHCIKNPVLCAPWRAWSAVLRGDALPSSLPNPPCTPEGVAAAVPGVFWSVLRPGSYRDGLDSRTTPDYVQVPATCLMDALTAAGALNFGPGAPWRAEHSPLSLWDTAARPAIAHALAQPSISACCMSSSTWWWGARHRRILSRFLKATRSIVPWDTQEWVLPGALSGQTMDLGSLGHLAQSAWTLSQDDLWALRAWWTRPNQAGHTMLDRLPPERRAWCERLLLRSVAAAAPALGSRSAGSAANQVDPSVLASSLSSSGKDAFDRPVPTAASLRPDSAPEVHRRL